MSNQYDREKTLAVLTGIVCCLVFLGGTILGGYHAIISIGIFAGLLAIASYGIADAAVAWSSYIDHQESRTPMEWTAWTVKYIISFYLLFAGGCIAYVLFLSADDMNARNASTERCQPVLTVCLKDARNANARNACQKAFQSCQTNENEQNATSKQNVDSEAAKTIRKFINFPLFNYIPGIMGLIGIMALTLVSKLNRSENASTNFFDASTQAFGASIRASTAQAAFQAPTNARGITIAKAGQGSARFRLSEGVRTRVVYFHPPRMQGKYCCAVSQTEYEHLKLATYSVVAEYVLAKIRSSRQSQASQEAARMIEANL